ncbi:MAG TPA: hypothetical protein VNG71_05965, partial [Pyrinomonadaceae bacterium]|nr:hypothetical protein [Pyrinomonadaceae bacterium]
DGKIGYRLIENLSGQTISERPEVNQNLDAVLRDLKQALVASGLYDKEADAMIKTWRNSWFEEGARVFYILPRAITDRVLPITIDPQPMDLVRVLVGRTELITPEMEKSVKRQAQLLNAPSARVRERARLAIQKYGRFSEPILKQIVEDETNPIVRARIKRLLETPVSE